VSLKDYEAKRDFRKTPEPGPGKSPAGRKRLIFVIQEHDASRLHYDLRLQEKDVLSSWAIPKTPPLEPGVKRLAIRTEDHPLGYAVFEGRIPEGEYGAGTVRIWDQGEYTPLEMTDDKKIVEIRGKKISGRYALIRLKSRPGEKDVNWLFFKQG
jgi:DNA ligase D-like protein (predicted 3'-phosphoesterase)